MASQKSNFRTGKLGMLNKDGEDDGYDVKNHHFIALVFLKFMNLLFLLKDEWELS